MRKLIQEIHNGKNIRENLKHYADIAVKTYVDYGTLEMTFSAYSLSLLPLAFVFRLDQFGSL